MQYGPRLPGDIYRMDIFPSKVRTGTVLYILPTPGEAKAKAMPGRLYIHSKINNNK